MRHLTPKFRKMVLQATQITAYDTPISPPVYRGKNGRRFEQDHEEKWPDSQPQGDNQQSLYRFGRGHDKGSLSRQLDLQLEHDAPALISSVIQPSDRLLWQQLDGNDLNLMSKNYAAWERQSRPAQLYKEANNFWGCRS